MTTNLQKATARIVLDHPFFASILLKYPMLPRTDIQAIAVDQRGQISYNPQFIESLPIPQIVFALCHEVLHRVGNHVHRIGSHDQKRWNHAADAWVNDTLNQSKVGEAIPGCVNIPGSASKTVEEIYNLLPVNPPQSKNGGCNGQGPIDDDLQPEGEEMDAAEAQAQEAQFKVDAAQAAAAARMRGKLPAHLARLVDDIIAVKVPWYDKLERFMVDKIKSDSQWNRPNRRYIGEDIYLPSRDSVGTMGEVVIGVDTSGSIRSRELDAFSSHINRIIESCRPSKVRVIYCDAKVNHVEEFGPEDFPVKLHPYGGGGTDLRHIFGYISEQGIDPVCGIVFSDMYTPFPDYVDFPTIWASTTDVAAPAKVGETVFFEVA